MSGFDSATATAPTDALLICPSVTGDHASPPSVVFHSPPPVAPKYASFGRPRTPAAAMDRPPRSGPMLRHRYALRMAESSGAAAVRARRPARVESMELGAAVAVSASTHAAIAKRECDWSIR